MKKNYRKNPNPVCPNCGKYKLQKFGGKVLTKKGYAIKYRCGECFKNFNSNSLEKKYNFRYKTNLPTEPPF